MVGEGFGLLFSLPVVVLESGPTIHSMYLEHLFESVFHSRLLLEKFFMAKHVGVICK